MLSRIPAGFPSPADDSIEQPLNLHELMVKHLAATFFLRVAGDSMTGAGIFPGDIMVVDKSLTPAQDSVVIAVVDGEFTCKRFHRNRSGAIWLVLRIQHISRCVSPRACNSRHGEWSRMSSMTRTAEEAADAGFSGSG
jgi:hypothetical protein